MIMLFYAFFKRILGASIVSNKVGIDK